VPFLSLPLHSDLVPWPALLAPEPPGCRSATRGSGDSRSDRDTRDTGRQLFLVEDNPADVDLVREALGALPFAVGVSTATDGEQALELLRESADRGVLPNLIFLDLNLPRMDGLDVLAQLKMHPALRDVPVVVLTSSSAARDCDRSRALHADDFVKKPLDVDDYFATVRSAARRWLPE
jgi:two-component system, chemotaxis family, response regulator Rcp1